MSKPFYSRGSKLLHLALTKMENEITDEDSGPKDHAGPSSSRPKWDIVCQDLNEITVEDSGPKDHAGPSSSRPKWDIVCQDLNEITVEDSGPKDHARPSSSRPNWDIVCQDLMTCDDDSSDLYEPSDIEKSSSSDTEENIRSRKKRKLVRWSQPEQSKWKKNITKENRKSGVPYITKKGFRRVKAPKDTDCTSCRWKCNIEFDDNVRKQICSEFWKLEYCRQKDFIIKYVSNEPTKTKRVRTGTGTSKNQSRVYFFQKGQEKQRVCKKFFLNTLSISHGPVEKALAGINDVGVFIQTDKRGKKEPPNKTDAEVLKRIKKHIESFPTIESHYCRKTTKRLYLDSNLSIRKMYSLFLEREKEINIKEPYASEITYRRYLCTNYNLSFFKPSKDQCVICLNYKNVKELDEKLVEEYHEHVQRKEEAYRAKEADKLRAENDKNFVSATFDLQCVLQIPSSEASLMYYSRKLCAYNLCVYESATPNSAYCFLWSELNGKRGSCEIGSALLQWILQIPDNVTEISLFSDTCGGQNRNQYISALLLYVVQKTHIEIIEHKFMESGHSYLQVDSMHSAIECAKRNVSVYTINDWINIMLMARSNRGKNKKSSKYIVKEFLFSDFVDLKSLSGSIIQNRTKDDQNEQVKWLKVKVIRYEKKNPGIIKFKYNIEDKEFRILQTFKGKTPPDMPAELNKLYKNQLPISVAKKKDLVNLCTKKVIPQEYHGWYKSLPVNKTVKDPATGSESDESSD